MGNLVKCKNCNGTGTDGHDRCFPPNPYICGLCNGKKLVSPELNKAFEQVWHLYHNQGNTVKELREENQKLKNEKFIEFVQCPNGHTEFRGIEHSGCVYCITLKLISER